MEYSVTIMNDASLSDSQGAIHTWLTINHAGADKEYFSFSNNDTGSLFGIDSVGKSTVDDALKRRKPTEQHTISITKNQYDTLVRESVDFYKEEPKYDLLPEGDGDYNCVTASHEILQRAGINYLKGAKTPYGVVNRINGIYFDHRRPITIPYGSKNIYFADFYLNYGGEPTWLDDAVRLGNLTEVKNLDNGQPGILNVRNANGNTPLHFAARFGHSEIVNYLIDEKGADILAVNNMKMTPLHFAALAGHLNVAENLVGRYLLKETAFNIADDVYGATPLHYAASSGNFTLVEYLINNGANVHEKAGGGDTPLHYAVSQGGNIEIVKLLIRKGSDISVSASDGTPTIHYAALGGHLDIVQYLVDTKYADITVTSNQIHTLHYAVRGGSLEVVEYFVTDKHLDVNVKDNVNGTPLHDAAWRDNLAIVKFLLRNGANANAKNKLNETPLDCARKKRNSTVVNCLQSTVSCLGQRRRRRRGIKNEHSLSVPYQGIKLNARNLVAGDFSEPAIQNQGENHKNVMLLNEVNSDFVGGSTMLMDLIARKYTGLKYETTTNVISKKEFIENKLSVAEEHFQKAMLNRELLNKK